MTFAWLLLAIAITLEVVATATLTRSEGFTNLRWGLATVALYSAAIFLLTRIVRDVPVSVTYAIWAGLGTAAVAVVGVVYLGESMSWSKGIGVALIVIGVVVVNLHASH